ncbi:MAG: hypothetical protein ACRDNI_07940 [Gaiellaceae bacterium]
MYDGDIRSDDGDEPHGLRPLLKPAQDRVLAALADAGAEEFTRSTYEEIAHVSRSQAAYDLADLVKLGLVDRLGAGRATRYRLAREGDGRRRKWTSARIRDELERFCSELGRWPRAAEFRDAGRGSLYLAASRYGGIEHWATELGFYEAAPAKPAGHGDLALDHPPGTALVMAGLAGLFVLGVVLIVQLMPANPSGSRQAQLVGVAPERVDAVPDGVSSRGSLAATPAAAELVVLRLAAAGDGSRIVARRGSAAGPLLWRGTLEAGESLRLRGNAIWLRVGTPASLAASVDGDALRLPPRARTVRVTAGGIRVLETAPAAPPVAPAPAQPVAATSPPTSPSPGTSEPAAHAGPAPETPPTGGQGPSPDPPPPGG